MQATGLMTVDTTHLRWILRHFPLEGRQVPDVLVVQPFHFEVQIHIVRALAQPVLFVLCGEESRQSGLKLGH